MTWWRRLFRRRKNEEDLEKELRFHLDQHAADLVEQGHDPEDENLPVARLRSLADHVSLTNADMRLFSSLFTVLAIIALALAVAGALRSLLMAPSTLLPPQASEDKSRELHSFRTSND